MTTLDKTALDVARRLAWVELHSHDGPISREQSDISTDAVISKYLALSSLPAQAVGVPVEVTAHKIVYAVHRMQRDKKAVDSQVRFVMSVLAPSQPAAVGERADALWEQLLPFMQVEECPPGDPYKDKVAALALIESALVHRDQVKL